jgi:hypothetical protein
MPYTIETKDGIVLQNIPDDVDPNSPQLKARVEKIRSERGVSQDVAKMREGNALARGARGAGATLQNAAYGIKGLVSDLSPEEQRTIAANKQFLDQDTAGKVGGFAADVASFALPGGLAAKGIAKGVSMLPRAAQVAAGLGANAAVDAGLSAAYSTEDRGDAALSGALGSVGGQLGGKLLTRAVGGLVRPSAEAQALMREGVQPTIGQAADQSTLSGRLIRKGEEIAESLPLIGSIVNRSRERAGNELTQTAFDRAVAPGGVKQAVSREGVDELGKQFKQAYGVLDQYVFKPDQQFEQDVLSIVANPNYRASKDTIDGVLSFFKRNFTDKFQQGPQGVGAFLSGDGFKALDSEIGRRIRDLAGQQGQEALAERRMLTAVEGALQQYRNRQLPSDVVQQLTDTDRAYAAWKRIARASKYSDSGEVTPAQLTRAVKAMSKGDDYGRGNAFMQDLTDPASILRNRTPNSGTADRAAAMALADRGLQAGLAGAAVFNPATFLPYAAGAAGLAGAYSRPAQKALLGGYSKQKAIEQALRRYQTDRLFGSAGAASLSE